MPLTNADTHQFHKVLYDHPRSRLSGDTLMNFGSNQFTRRTMLRGLGVTMALPWLESLPVWGDEPRGAGRASEAPVRLAVLFAGNGFHSKEWWAKGEGKSMELGQVLAPLND